HILGARSSFSNEERVPRPQPESKPRDVFSAPERQPFQEIVKLLTEVQQCLAPGHKKIAANEGDDHDAKSNGNLVGHETDP
ncbi:MAG: hypothetical protein VX181_19175, partial [Pseudomonadota bacterium]|nr:hypothetical protein [Pseudomonadota bacterium]